MPIDLFANHTNENVTELWTSSWDNATHPPEYENTLYFMCKHRNYKMSIEGTDVYCKFYKFIEYICKNNKKKFFGVLR